MDRRNFFKIISASSATAVATSCGTKSGAIPLLVPEHNIPIGEEHWHPAVCTECGAGCGTIVRVMGAERVIEVKGEKVRQRIAAVKKIEGNPLDPVSGGNLCARGQAVVQAIYHPDRLRGPMKRSGDRGKAQFSSVSWDDAIAAASEQLGKAKADPSKIVFLMGPQTGTRSLAIQKFLAALKAPGPVVCSLADFAIERKAAENVFGWKGLPVYDLANADHILGVGADFLAGWASPVFYARQYGEFRNGRAGIRGIFVQAESRLSVTASAADKWLALTPGSEPQFIAAVARILIDAKLAPNVSALPANVAQAFRTADVAVSLKACGLEEKRALPAILEFGKSRAPLMVAGASVPHTNSLDAITASHYLNLMLGNPGKPGGILAPPASAAEPVDDHSVAAAIARAQVVLIDGANPAFTLPKSSGILEALGKAQTVISFAPILDDSAAWADFILPDHHPIESSIAVAAAVSDRTSIAIAEPFVEPLYETRSVEKTLADLAGKLSLTYSAITPADVVKALLKGEGAYEEAAREGGIWIAPDAKAAAIKPGKGDLAISAAVFSGDAAQFPLYFQPYLSLQFHDGNASHLPWMQELPDPASSAIWGLPVEIDPKLAAQLGISTGDAVKLESPHGSFEASAFVNPAAVPGVVSMGIGGGHSHYSRYGSDRGANPLSILAPTWEKTTGALAMGATRVKLTRVGESKTLVQFSTQNREKRGFDYR